MPLENYEFFHQFKCSISLCILHVLANNKAYQKFGSEQTKMAPSLSAALFLVILCLCPLSGAGVGFDPAEVLKVSASDFVGSVQTTIDIVQQVTSVVAKVGNVFGDFRLSNAVSDCLDLLQLSADELSSTLSASQNPNGMFFTLLSFYNFLEFKIGPFSCN